VPPARNPLIRASFRDPGGRSSICLSHSHRPPSTGLVWTVCCAICG
jgi:hypothetical protein